MTLRPTSLASRTEAMKSHVWRRFERAVRNQELSRVWTLVAFANAWWQVQNPIVIQLMEERQ